MNIAVLAWGSLVPHPRGLRISGQWQFAGPELPVEFSRVSKDARLTLVVDLANGVKVRTRWAQSGRRHLGDAVADLRDREGTVLKRIGFIDIANGHRSNAEFSDQADVFAEVEAWLRQQDLEGAVWTALPSNFEEQTKKQFSVDAAVEYLVGLPRSAREAALRYIEEAPEEVRTPVRTEVARDSRLRVEQARRPTRR